MWSKIFDSKRPRQTFSRFDGAFCIVCLNLDPLHHMTIFLRKQIAANKIARFDRKD